MKKRRGSILATSVSMIAIFLTMIVASMAYLESSTKTANADRWRLMADQAARTGLDFVMGWAESNIDRETSLPRDWANMNDGQVINPVALYAQGATVENRVSQLLSPTAYTDDAVTGTILGTNVGEYVLGRSGPYLITFKARIQQYRVSEDTPRQFRIGIIGRVRTKARPFTVANDTPDSREGRNGTLVAERLLMTEVGKVPTSRYAALIDIDLVKNWVPGEQVWGPVHINRGYPDDNTFRTANVRISNGSLGGQAAVAQRSQMKLHVNPGSLFDTPAGASDTPIFWDAVSVTSTRQNQEIDFPNWDEPNHSTSVRLMHQLTEKNLNAVGGVSATIFRAQENQARPEWGGIPGPIVLTRPVTLPTSVRNSLPVALGVPIGVNIRLHTGFANLVDGVYLPSTNWWNNTNFDGDEFANTAGNVSTGGMYIRGNVEVMRMGVEGNYSYYLYQMGYGGRSVRRVYGVLVNRSTRDVWLKAWAGTGGAVNAGGGFAGDEITELTPGNMTVANLFPGASPANGNLTGSGTQVTGGLAAFALTNNTAVWARLSPKPGSATALAQGRVYPLNGVVYVDYSKSDPNRVGITDANPNPATITGADVMRDTASPAATLTGNIFALGDPTLPVTNRKTLSGNAEERVATYSGAASGPASRLTIMTRGNVFIQNHIYLQSLIAAGFPPQGLTSVANDISIADSKDLLGIVADKQVVIGLHAPSNATRANVGTAIHATIAALGDPGADVTGAVPAHEKIGSRAFRGSFTTEGLMQSFPDTSLTEGYGVCTGLGPGFTAEPRWTARGYMPFFLPGPTPGTPPIYNPYGLTQGYPGNPIYHQLGSTRTSLSQNPNTIGLATRGRLLLFGSVTQKKRGILGVGNRSYDKDIRFDRRLLTIAPPIFPTSLNLVVRSQNPKTPDSTDLSYRGGSNGTNTQFNFLNTDSAIL